MWLPMKPRPPVTRMYGRVSMNSIGGGRYGTSKTSSMSVPGVDGRVYGLPYGESTPRVSAPRDISMDVLEVGRSPLGMKEMSRAIDVVVDELVVAMSDVVGDGSFASAASIVAVAVLVCVVVVW